MSWVYIEKETKQHTSDFYLTCVIGYSMEHFLLYNFIFMFLNSNITISNNSQTNIRVSGLDFRRHELFCRVEVVIINPM